MNKKKRCEDAVIILQTSQSIHKHAPKNVTPCISADLESNSSGTLQLWALEDLKNKVALPATCQHNMVSAAVAKAGASCQNPETTDELKL